jgi:hypothetical protein
MAGKPGRFFHKTSATRADPLRTAPRSRVGAQRLDLGRRRGLLDRQPSAVAAIHCAISKRRSATGLIERRSTGSRLTKGPDGEIVRLAQPLACCPPRDDAGTQPDRPAGRHEGQSPDDTPPHGRLVSGGWRRCGASATSTRDVRRHAARRQQRWKVQPAWYRRWAGEGGTLGIAARSRAPRTSLAKHLNRRRGGGHRRTRADRSPRRRSLSACASSARRTLLVVRRAGIGPAARGPGACSRITPRSAELKTWTLDSEEAVKRAVRDGPGRRLRLAPRDPRRGCAAARWSLSGWKARCR